jgi:8-oxo-dGTP diphosphatase
VIHVVCALIIENRKILITQRSEKMNLPLKWEFPGGKLEVNESYEEGLKREIKEELNLNISVKKRLDDSIHHYDDFSIKLIPFISEILSGDVLLNEHRDYKFVEIHKLLDFDWAEADIPIVNQLLSMQL